MTTPTISDQRNLSAKLEDALAIVEAELQPGTPEEPIELSVVMPCLNEADTLATCITKARTAMREHNIDGEIIVADNGSDDGSIQIAEELGARVVHVKDRGYGNALMGGIAAARGEFVIMGDADDSYDFLEIPKFVNKLREGHELVQGCRLPGGGGTVKADAMPWSHRWIGNPMFTTMVRKMFRAPIHDVYCGLRGFRKDMYEQLDQRCTGMEFATEMIIKSSLFGRNIAEVPITLHPDGRVAHAPHLRTIRDGWRTLRFFLMYSPRWLFLVPGILLTVLGVLGYSLAMPGVKVLGATLDAHTLLFSSLAVLLGFQFGVFAVLAKTFAISERLMPPSPLLTRFQECVTLERASALGVLAIVVGAGLLLSAVGEWHATGYGALEYPHTMRLVIPGVTATVLGFQAIGSSFLMSLLLIRRR